MQLGLSENQFLDNHGVQPQPIYKLGCGGTFSGVWAKSLHACLVIKYILTLSSHLDTGERDLLTHLKEK